MASSTPPDNKWVSLCTSANGCCPEFRLTPTGIELRENGATIVLSEAQLERIARDVAEAHQAEALRHLDRDSV